MLRNVEQIERALNLLVQKTTQNGKLRGHPSSKI